MSMNPANAHDSKGKRTNSESLLLQVQLQSGRLGLPLQTTSEKQLASEDSRIGQRSMQNSFSFLTRNCAFSQPQEGYRAASASCLYKSLETSSIHQREEDGEDPEKETLKAAAVVGKCAKIFALSVVVDLIVNGIEFVDWSSHEGFLTALRTLWKLSFAYRMHRVCALLTTVATSSKESANRGQDILKCLVYLRRTWRSSAIMITLCVTSNVVLAWQHAIPQIREYLVLLLLAVSAVTVYVSSNETQEVMASETKHDDTTTTSSTIWVDIQKQAILTNRALSFCGAAFWLQAFLIPFMALAHYWEGSYHDAILTLLDLTSPMSMALLLRSCRHAQLEAVLQAIPTKGGNDKKAVQSNSQSKLKFALSQQEFFGEVNDSVWSEIKSKALFVAMHPLRPVLMAWLAQATPLIVAWLLDTTALLEGTLYIDLTMVADKLSTLL